MRRLLRTGLSGLIEMRVEIEGFVSGYKVLPSVDGLTLEGIGDEE